MSTTGTTPPDIDRDPMWHQAYMDVQAVLDQALGTEEEDGAGGGIAGDVALLASQRDEARAGLARLKRTAALENEPALPGMDLPPPGEQASAVTLEAIREVARKARYGEPVDTYTWDCVVDAILVAVAGLLGETTP